MDLETLRGIAELMKDNGITRLRLEEGGLELELERGCTPPAPAVPTLAPATPQPACTAQAQGVSDAAAAGCEAAASEPAFTHEVAAPMVGVFYVAPSPGAEPFVRVGSKVKKGDTLCILEAMKLMNEVVAEKDGEVVEVCCEDGELVEYGRALFRIY